MTAQVIEFPRRFRVNQDNVWDVTRRSLRRGNPTWSEAQLEAAMAELQRLARAAAADRSRVLGTS